MEKLESLVIDTDKFQIDVNGKSLIKEAIEIDVHITKDSIEVTSYKSMPGTNEVTVSKWLRSLFQLRRINYEKNNQEENHERKRMKVIQVYRTDTEEVITSLTEDDQGNVYGITDSEYSVIVDGKKMVQENEKSANKAD